MNKKGIFVISLDFELMWGVRDKMTLETYGKNILGVWEAIPKILQVFEEHKIRGTWATVGFLFASSKKELIDNCPAIKPNYIDKNLSPYGGYFELVNKTDEIDKYHFASKLIDMILQFPEQEIATHTYSHYYCLESGQKKEDFKNDIMAAIEIAKKKNIKIESIVFPRNQFNCEYLKIISDLGITSYRGNEKFWLYKEANLEEVNFKKRAIRLLDSYINISGHNTYSLEEIEKKKPYDFPSSRFLRPYSSNLKVFERLRLRRILKSMTYAAKRGEVFHLWWHPHNFGINQNENFYFLNKILSHYTQLNIKYDFRSYAMKDLSKMMEEKCING